MYRKLLREKYQDNNPLQGQTPQNYPSACCKPQPPVDHPFRPNGAAAKRTSMIRQAANPVRRTNVKQSSMNREKQIQ